MAMKQIYQLFISTLDMTSQMWSRDIDPPKWRSPDQGGPNDIRGPFLMDEYLVSHQRSQAKDATRY
jgi:hypothetical protein